jgi:hydrogenase maturation protease
MSDTAVLTAPDLVFGYGNPSRGDDALGPMFLDRVRAATLGDAAAGGRELLTDFQLQPEHALDLRGRRRVLFVDASATCAEPFELRRLAPAPQAPVFSHAYEPGALLAVYQRIERAPAPPAWTLAIRGYAFELGAPLSAKAEANLDAALRWAHGWLALSAVPAEEVEL